MDKGALFVRFEDLSGSEAGVEARNLQTMLRESAPDVDATLQRERGDTQDMGATLILLLGTPAAIALAKGVSAYIRQRGARPGKLVFEQRNADGSPKNTLTVDASSADVAKFAEAIRSMIEPGASQK